MLTCMGVHEYEDIICEPVASGKHGQARLLTLQRMGHEIIPLNTDQSLQ